MDEKVSKEVEDQFQALEHLPISELREIVQDFAVAHGLLESIPPGPEGIKLLELDPRVRQDVCQAYHEHRISKAFSLSNVSAVAGILALLFTGVSAIVIGVTALAVLILKQGLDRYCRNVTPASSS